MEGLSERKENQGLRFFGRTKRNCMGLVVLVFDVYYSRAAAGILKNV